MSKNLTSVAVQEFDAEVKHAFQGGGKLREAVTLRTGVTGDSYKFTRMGKGLANQKASQADVTPMDIAHARQTATMANYNAPEYTDIFDQAEVNFDEKQELASCIAMALARREDQIIIDSMLSGVGLTYTASGSIDADTDISNGTTIAAGATGMTLTKLTQTSRWLNERGAPSGDRHMALGAEDVQELLELTEIGSSDYNSIKALVQGDIDTFMGFKMHMIETRKEGGLPTNIAYAWHKSAIGYAVGLDQMTEVNYVAQKTSWLCNGILKSAAVVREGAGVVEVNTDTA